VGFYELVVENPLRRLLKDQVSIQLMQEISGGFLQSYFWSDVYEIWIQCVNMYLLGEKLIFFRSSAWIKCCIALNFGSANWKSFESLLQKTHQLLKFGMYVTNKM